VIDRVSVSARRKGKTPVLAIQFGNARALARERHAALQESAIQATLSAFAMHAPCRLRNASFP
jgi:hypothetical protein